jgi:hypothetical protein
LSWPAGVPLTGSLAAARFEVHDGGSWRDAWPSPNPVPARGLRLKLTRSDAIVIEQMFPLGMLHWKRHDE